MPSSSSSSNQAPSQRTSVLDSYLIHRELGRATPGAARGSAAGQNMVFLHGNPTSSYVWRGVLPRLAGRARCLAPDLIGMGQSGKPEIAYRFHDHARYLDAWFEALGLQDVVLVGYDWGGVLALDWAARNPERVRGVVVFETFLRPMQWSDFPPQGEQLFRALRTPGVGEAMVLERNEFLERSLENGVKRGLSEQERAVYYAPYPDARSRRPTLQWPREIPIAGQPADVAAVVERNGRWLANSARVPKLLLTFDGPILSNAPSVVAWAKETATNLEVVPLGAAGHHAPEDAPDAISAAIDAWLTRHGLN